MAISDLFKRTKTCDCLLIDEVADGMPITEGDLKRLVLDGDTFQDRHKGLLWVRDRSIRPIRVNIDKKMKEIYLIANRCGSAMGTVMLHEANGAIRKYELRGQTLSLTVDDLVMKIWTDPAMAYNINDNNGLKSLTKQNLLGIEMLLLLTVGIILGWFIIGPMMNFLIGYVIHIIASFMAPGGK